MSRDPRVDRYVEAAAPFARPILEELRRRVHAAAPGVGEAIKWSMPAFLWQGRQIANMAAFKAHAVFGFWDREVAGDPATEPNAMGQFGRLTSLDQLPDEAAFADMVAEAIRRAQAGGTVPRPVRHPKPVIAMPEDLAAALAAGGVTAAFDAMPPGARREYLEWVTTARQPATRARRVETLVAQVAEGKKLHWKYAASC